LLTESVLLALVGGGAGLLLAAWGVEALMALAPEDLPRVKDVSIDSWALLFTLGITTVTGLGFGIVPALQASRPDPNETLKDAGRGSTAGARKQRARSILVIAEVALALVVLVCGGLLMRSFWRLQQVEPGFNPKNVLTVRLFLPESKYLEKWRSNDFYNKLIGKVSTLPGVQSVGGSNVLPVTDPFYLGVVIEGRPRVIDSDLPKTNYFAVTPDYFKAMGIPLMRGRVFNEHDTGDSRRVVIINDTMARHYFPDEDPIGKRIHITMGEEIFREIVGIVGDVKQGGLDHATEAQTYEPFSQEPDRFFNLVVRTEGDPASLGSAIRAKVLEIDSEQPVSTIQTMEQVLATSVARQRFSTIVLCIFASVALVLTAVGIYGVISYSVTQRRHELGIRMAMGAQRSDVIKLVVGHGALLATTGVSIGLIVALVLTRVMEGLLFGVSATDPLTFAAISALLIGVALAACFVPARRATRVDPMAALRCE
jgi:putative ABC transport system permease protein